jgi:hypothetical protein
MQDPSDPNKPSEAEVQHVVEDALETQRERHQLAALRANVDAMLKDPEAVWLALYAKDAIDRRKVPPLVLCKVLLCGTDGGRELYARARGANLQLMMGPVGEIENAIEQDLADWQRRTSIEIVLPMLVVAIAWIATQFGLEAEQLTRMAQSARLQRSAQLLEGLDHLRPKVGLGHLLQRTGFSIDQVARVMREAVLPPYAPLEGGGN